MSGLQKNNGKLIPVETNDYELFAEKIINYIEKPSGYSTWLEYLTDVDIEEFKYIMLDKILYKIVFEKNEQEIEVFVINKNDNDNFDFNIVFNQNYNTLKTAIQTSYYKFKKSRSNLFDSINVFTIRNNNTNEIIFSAGIEEESSNINIYIELKDLNQDAINSLQNDFEFIINDGYLESDEPIAVHKLQNHKIGNIICKIKKVKIH